MGSQDATRLKNKKIHFIAGLPRSGSTLLLSILNQNASVYGSNNSGLCQILWDNKVACRVNASQQLVAADSCHVEYDICTRIANLYYERVNQPIVIDKCRSWTLPANLELIHDYITDKPKIIVMVRSTFEVVISFMHLWQRAGRSTDDLELFREDSEPLVRPFWGVRHAASLNDKRFLFVKYDDLVTAPQSEVARVVEFLGLPKCDYDLDNITNKYPDSKKSTLPKNLHKVRKRIVKRSLSWPLSPIAMEMCFNFDQMLKQDGVL